MTSTLPELHATYLRRTHDAVAGDDRFRALLAGGSYVHGGFDAHSDLDLVLVVEDEVYAEVMAARRPFAERIGPLVSAFTGEHVGEPRLLICLYGPPLLHVDLKFVVGAGLARMVERPAVVFARDPVAIAAMLDEAEVCWPDRSPEWFEDRAWVWLHYAAGKLVRGELYEALGMLAFFREQVVGPMLHRRAGRPQRGVRRVEALGLDSADHLTATLAGHDEDATAAAIRAAIDAYLDLRADAPPAKTAPGMPRDLMQMMDA